MNENTMAKNIFVQMTGGIYSAPHPTLEATFGQLAKEHGRICSE